MQYCNVMHDELLNFHTDQTTVVYQSLKIGRVNVIKIDGDIDGDQDYDNV